MKNSKCIDDYVSYNYTLIVFTVFKSLGKKVFPCPSCKKKYRIPIKLGQVLSITCPHCSAVFELTFETPIDSIKKQFSNLHITDHLTSLLKNSKWRPLLIAVALIVVLTMYSLFTPSNSGKNDQPKAIKNSTSLPNNTFLDIK